jgi:predicted regulator of amino acid metabolism with ACT domain
MVLPLQLRMVCRLVRLGKRVATGMARVCRTVAISPAIVHKRPGLARGRCRRTDVIRGTEP